MRNNLQRTYWRRLALAAAAAGLASLTCAQTPPRVALGEQLLHPVADTWVDGDGGNSRQTVNFGSQATMHVYGDNDGPAIRLSAISDMLLRFDLSSLPAGSTITNATLRLYWLNDGRSSLTLARTVYVLGALKSWTEGNSSAGSGATFNTCNGVTPWDGGNINISASNYDTSPAASRSLPHDVSVANTYLTFTITSLAAAWHSGGRTNQGLVVTCKGWVEYDVQSREGLFPPELIIQYAPPPPPPPHGLIVLVR
ncbi:MAG: DNRLRE domain-containing protein [Lentisphaerae bacterium]|nr:DNRLRE domain-containing protein [Lentisphaerota bacterium]